MKLYHIVATTEELGIGINNKLPWKIPEELHHFKELTTDCESNKHNVVIMGRKTWDSIPQKVKPLKERINIVLTKDKSFTGNCTVCNSLRSIFETLNSLNNIDKVFIIGGSTIYNQFLRLPLQHIVYITKVSRVDQKIIVCDTYFPDIENFDYKLLYESDVFTTKIYRYKYQTFVNF